MKNLYFVGAGGIGMANLERYFLRLGKRIGGYDRVSSELSRELEKEGVTMIYEDDETLLSEEFRNPEDTLVVFTPAVPSDSRLLTYFRENGFEIVKRARLLGKVTEGSKAICVAGSHGKTTTCSMIANILRDSKMGCNAFLGGILRNTGSNFVCNPDSEWSVIEADEYDRSFHQLSPTIAVVTSMDPDHLDIYGDEKGYIEGFCHFIGLIKKGGTLLLHEGLNPKDAVPDGVTCFTYSGNDKGDWHAEDITFGNGAITFTLVGPDIKIENLEPGVPVEINIDNAVAAAAAAFIAGASPDEIREGLKSFRGAKRRFEIHLKGENGKVAFIDDYAHSPNEVLASIKSVRKLYPGRHITVVFQPHLYTRTRDFADGFALALSEADRIIMPEIYPARELPIEGVDSQMVLKKVKKKDKIFCERKNLLNLIKNTNFDILMTMGAADIDVLIPRMVEILETKAAIGGTDV